MQAAHTSSRPLSPGPKLAVGALVVVGALVALAALGNLTQVLIALLVIGVILIVVGCLALPFLLVGLAVYGLTRLVPTGRHARFGPRPVVTPAGGVPAAPAPAAAVQPRAPDLPPDLAAQVARIQEK